jgi:hypothetical protein
MDSPVATEAPPSLSDIFQLPGGRAASIEEEEEGEVEMEGEGEQPLELVLESTAGDEDPDEGEEEHFLLSAGENSPPWLIHLKVWWKQVSQHPNMLFLRRYMWVVLGAALLGLLLVAVLGLVVIAYTFPLFQTISNPNNVRENANMDDKFLSTISNGRLREYVRELAGQTHVAGTPNGLATAKTTQAHLDNWGYQTQMETYYPLLSYPLSASVILHTLAAPSTPASSSSIYYECSLVEPAIEEDPSTSQPGIFPAFHGYSPSGNVTGPLVYANYGRLEDFKYLEEEAGVSVAGKIVIVRYGKIFRGLKVQLAEERGALAVLIYSDPGDDGAGRGDVFPTGPWRPPHSLQRGSVARLSHMAGDPLTPGWAATREAPRLERAASPMLPTIPSLPLSAADALPLLRALVGSGSLRAPIAWEGALFSGSSEDGYFLGPSTHGVVVTVVQEVSWERRPIYNVIGTWPAADGSLTPAVVLGGHRDAWVFGAADPISGHSCLLEIARALAHMSRSGYRFPRALRIASWDAEEYGLVGSTEHMEDHSAWLSANAVAYLNLDAAITGSQLRISASPALAEIVKTVSNIVMDPATKYPLSSVNRIELGNLGSGSDFTPFFQHLGIPALDAEFAGDYGVYHSAYDSIAWMERFGDPSFAYHVAMSQFMGLITLHLLKDPIVPLEYTHYGNFLQSEVDKLIREVTTATNGQWSEVAVDCLQKEVTKFIKVAALSAGEIRNMVATTPYVERINQAAMSTERGFILPQGLRGRPFYRHAIFAPGLHLGYGAVVFPGPREAMQESGDVAVVQSAIDEVCECIGAAADLLSVPLY